MCVDWLSMGATRNKSDFDLSLMRQDMAVKGWLNTDLACSAKVSDMTVSRFFHGKSQTARTVKKLARALGYSVRRYLHKVAA